MRNYFDQKFKTKFSKRTMAKSLSRKQIKKYKEIFGLDKHQKYISYLFKNIRDEQFFKEVDKYGLLKTIKKHVS